MLMKKIIALILCIQILNIPAFAGEIINDVFVEKTLYNKNLSVPTYKQQEIEDSFVNSTLKNKDQKIEPNFVPVTDGFVEKNLSADKYKMPTDQPSPIQDEFAVKTLKECPQVMANKYINYDFDCIKRTPVKIAITNNITTKNSLAEGQELTFKVLSDVKIDKNNTIKKDSVVKARLETVSLNQAFGVPADINIENFVIKRANQPDIVLDGSIHKIGANRSLWVYPVGYMGIVLFLGAGVLVFPIRGGHAKLTTNDVFEVYYVPNL